MAREITDILADLTGQVVGAYPRPMQIAAFYVALRGLSIADFDVLVRELTMDQHGIAPLEPPKDWNPVKSRAYSILLGMGRLTIIA